MRGSSPAKDSPGHSNRNSAASSDSGRGFSTGHTDSKPVHSYVNVHVNNHHQQQQQQHRLSGQSYESGVSSRQSYHSTSSSSVGSLDRLEEPTITSTINVAQLFQAGVPDKEVLQAWLHELHFEEYYPLFYQAGYDMPTISRMTPEDLTAIGITKPAHRKRLKAEIARLNIHDGIPDYKPNDLMEWLHLLGLGAYLDTLCGQGYDTLDYVTDITWEDLEEIGIQKLGHQKKIMLAIDRLKRITSGAKRLSSVDGRTASLELLEPPPPAPPISGRWSGGEISAIPAHVYEGALGGARPKKSPSGDSISTTSSANSGSSAGSGPHSTGAGNTGAAGGEMRVIPLPREDAGLAGAMPFRHNNNNSNLQPDVVAIQVKRNMRPSSSEERREVSGQQLMYQSFQGPSRRSSDNEMFVEPVPRSHEAEGVYSVASAIGGVVDKRRGRSSSKSESEKHEVEINADGKKLGFQKLDPANHNNHNNSMSLRVDTGEHIYDTPQISPSQKSPKPAVMPKPTAPFPPASGMTGPLQVNISNDPALVSQAKPGSPGGKKIPPPPPKRTHSIRGEVMAAPEVAPGSPSKHVAPSTITVSASIHPQPTTITASKHTPPPVMQKPQKPLSPAVVNKMQAQPPYGQHPLPQQLAQAQPQLSVSQSSSQHQQSAMPAHTHKLPAPTTSQTHSSPAHSASQSAPVFSKPKVSIPGQPAQLQQQPSQPQSPTPAKSPLAHTMTNVPQSQPQQHQPPQLSAGHGHVLVRPGAPAQPLTTAQTAKSPATASPAHQPASLSPAVQQPQVQAFASCVKSLSEKFGKNTEEDDQFPDNVSTDSDDFPPPPPPIAMDIITPKIHNYGIPSRERGKPEFGIHQRPRPNQPGARNFAAGPVGQQKVSRVSGHHMQAAPLMVTANKAGPGTDQSAAVQLRRQPNVSAGSAMSKSDHERTPETDAVSAISNDKRSESTTSFESNSSSSSVDSNTLPFANENVGTIKQRAANAKPSVVQSVEEDDGQKNLDLNADMFDSESHQILSGYSNSASSYSSYSSQPHPQHGPSMASRSSYSSNVHHQPHAQDQHQQPNYHRQTSQPATASASSGAIRPPVPNKKPALSPKPARPKAEPASTQPAEQAPPPTLPSQPSAAAPQPPAVTESKLESGNVLSDIDDMLQGLTDELDAMLEEEMGS